MNRLLIFVFSITLITNVSAEDLTDIQISSPVMDKATISNEAIEEVNKIVKKFLTPSNELKKTIYVLDQPPL